MGRSKEPTFSMGKLAVTMATITSVLQNVRTLDVQPQAVKLPSPPTLEGPLEPNYYLAKAKQYMRGKILGPGSMVVVNRHIYTGLQNGWVVEIRPDGHIRRILRMSTKSCGTVSMDEKACGRPLGIRADRLQFLIVADAYKGIFRIHPRTGQFAMLVDGSKPVNGKPLGYINDLAVARDGTIFFTSSSAKYNRTSSMDIILEGESTGRVLVYNPRETPQNRVRELISGLHYPSGLQLSRDENYLLIGESARAKIHRAWIGAKSPKRGVMETFADNLPGFVANIRLSPRNTYWVALSASRSKDKPSLLDMYGDQPDRRRDLMAMKPSAVQAKMPKYGIVVELDQNGKILRSLHDPHARKYTGVTEVEEEHGILYFGSRDSNFVGLLDLRRLLPPGNAASQPGGGGSIPIGGSGVAGGGGIPGMNLGSSPSGSSDHNVERFLDQVRKNTRSLSGNELQNIVIVLVRRLVEAVSEIRRVMAQASTLRNDLDSLQKRIPNTTSSEASSTTENPVSPTTWFDFGHGSGYGVTSTQEPYVTTQDWWSQWSPGPVTTATTTTQEPTTSTTTTTTEVPTTTTTTTTEESTTSTSTTSTAEATSTTTATSGPVDT